MIGSHNQRSEDIADKVLWLEDGQFKETVTIAIDPLCKMVVEKEKAPGAEWSGMLYNFCAKGCQDEFIRENRKIIINFPREKERVLSPEHSSIIIELMSEPFLMSEITISS